MKVSLDPVFCDVLIYVMTEVNQRPYHQVKRLIQQVRQDLLVIMVRLDLMDQDLQESGKELEDLGVMVLALLKMEVMVYQSFEVWNDVRQGVCFFELEVESFA